MKQIYTLVLLFLAITCCTPAPTPIIPPTTPTLRPRPTPTETMTPMPTPDARLPIMLWHALTGTQRGAVNALIDKFNASHPDIQLSVTSQGSGAELASKLAASANSADSPDIVLAYPTELALLNKSGVLVPLDDAQQFLNPDDLKDIFPAFLDHYPQSGNRVYSVGFGRHLQVMYYNADMLKNAGVSKMPETWDDLAKACAAVIKNPDLLCFELDPNALDFESALLSRGGALISSDGRRATFDQKPGLESLQFIAEAFKSKYASQTTRALQQQWDFAAGKLAFTFDTTLALTAYDRQTKNAGKNFAWGIAVPPRTIGSIVMAYGPSAAIVKRTPEKQQAAFTFMKWMLDKDANSDWVLGTNAFPPRTATKDNLSEYIKTNGAYGTAFNWLRFARTEPNISAWPSVRGLIAESMIAVANGKVLPADALREATARASQVLGQ